MYYKKWPLVMIKATTSIVFKQHVAVTNAAGGYDDGNDDDDGSPTATTTIMARAVMIMMTMTMVASCYVDNC